MTKLEKTKYHKVFAAELQGDTMVVSPQGDAAGFRDSDIAIELKTLMELANDPRVANLVVDFGRSNYFGSVIIGAVHNLGVKVRAGGGKLGMCEISDEMLETLRTLKLDTIWTHYDSLKAALKAFKS
jgi:anti-anti-sigma regulatory factor